MGSGRAGGPTGPAAKLCNVPLLNTVCGEHLLTGNKNLGFGVFHGSVPESVTRWSRADIKQVTAHKVAWGRSVERSSAECQKQAMGDWSGWGGVRF